jgi:hypothetical protein
MGPDLLRRIRWGNVGRLAGAVAVIGAVAAWPLLAPPKPALPGEAARPLDGLASPTATPPAELLVPRPPRAVRRPRGRARRPHARKKREAPNEARPRDGGRDATERRSRPDDSDGGPERGVTGEDGGQRESGGREEGAGRSGDPAQTEFGFERDRARPVGNGNGAG